MEYILHNLNEKIANQKFSYYVLGIDIGGTNTNLGIAGIKNQKPILLFSHNYNSKKIDSLVPVINNTLKYTKNKYKIEVDYSCIGAAGIISLSNDFVKLTNAEWNVSSNEIIEKTSLKKLFIINDFQAIGYGLNLLDLNNNKDIIRIRKGNNEINHQKTTKVIIGAGTGLGKCILTYDEHFDAYIPIPSEGGHSDFPAQNKFEMQLAEFVKKLRGISMPLSYEELLSGRGIEGIYLFLRDKKDIKETEYTKEIDSSAYKTPLISKYKNLDETCKETFRLFTRIYARCAKNFVLDALSRGGLYIAGGIAAKNKDIFSTKEFINEFENAFNRKEFLKEIPINIIINYDVSLYGACYAAMLKLLSKKSQY